MQVIYAVFLPLLPGIFNGFSADGDGVTDGLPDGSTDESNGDGVTDGLPDGSTDESNDVQMEGNFPKIVLLGNFVKEFSWIFSP